MWVTFEFLYFKDFTFNMTWIHRVQYLQSPTELFVCQYDWDWLWLEEEDKASSYFVCIPIRNGVRPEITTNWDRINKSYLKDANFKNLTLFEEQILKKT